MKDQYFGDINDYRKYGLLRAIIRASGFRLLVVWMLTPDDGSNHGRLISYLEHPGKWSRHDLDLFKTLKELLPPGRKRRVNLIENTGCLSRAEYFSSYVPDTASGRSSWFGALTQRAQRSDFVFLDPDNGLEVISRAYGRKNSSKFLYWREVESLWASGNSLLIYQHFTREKRLDFIQRILKVLRSATPNSFVEAFSTPHVVFMMALQPVHQEFHEAIVSSVQENWGGQIQHWELTRDKRTQVMNLPTTEEFEHKSKKFKITTTAAGSKFTVVVTLNGVQVSPVYSVELTTHLDYFMEHKSSLIGHLIDVAKSDIQNGMYYKG